MKRKFTWENFGVDFLKDILYNDNTPVSKRPKVDINDIDSLTAKVGYLYAYPDERFVRKYKDVIIDDFFANSTALFSLFQKLERNHYSNIRVGNEEEMLERLHGMRLTSTVISLILDEMYRHGKIVSEDFEGSIYRTPKIVDLKSATANKIPLRNYQEDAKNALYNHFIKEDNDSGILVMPTGSGKTRVASAFLLEDMVSRGWQIIWLTHRSMLIEQTADTIYSLSPAIKLNNSEKETFEMVCVSGSHSTVRATRKSNDVIIFGVQALIRNLPFLKGCLKDNVMIIVDEMHHALAPSYQTIIKEIKKNCRQAKLLGLTATPIRINDYDTARLMKIFDNKIVYSISMNELIVSGVLSEPKYIPINTSIDFASTITVDEAKYIEKWEELPPNLLERMTHTAERNKIIVDTYLKDKTKFGKTIIFAVNAEHCISLCEDLQNAGVKCDYIYCAHPGNDEKIRNFREGKIEVLVNINMLTEGSDVPDIQSVFLTRPTSSDVLLMQMIGRGMRGEDCGGTKEVNIVSFNDVWGRFNFWLNPRFIIENELNNENTVDNTTKLFKELPDESERKSIPWEALRYLLDNIHVRYKGDLNSEIALPAGWIDAIDSDGADRKILVFESQLAGYIEMRKNKELLKEGSEYNPTNILKKCFPEFGLIPSEEDIETLASHYRITGEFPHIYPFSGRKKIDAATVASELKSNNVGLGDVEKEIEKIYEENADIIKSIYGSKNDYRTKIFNFISYKNGIVPNGMKIEEIPDESIDFEYGNAYDLQELVNEVKAERFNNNYGTDIPVYWTKKPYKTYFGEYRWNNDNDLSKSYININCILNSNLVDKEVVKYVIYHELLHRDNHKHDKSFRAKEHEYPNWTELEKILFVDFARFDIKEW